MTEQIVGIRFKKAGKVYYFDPAGLELEVNDYVIVETSRGLELGRVVIAPRQVLAHEAAGQLKPVMRKAEPEDIERARELEDKAEEALIECGKMIEELKLPMKLLSAEYNFDGSRLTFLFSAAERVDFRELVRRLTRRFKVKVELRQVGTRDEAKLMGGFGRCGRPLCCMSFISEFEPVSIRMAKDQDLPLNPMKISGICGRLMCCLSYECEQYRAVKEKLPKVGQRVSTAMGEAKVVGSNPLKETVVVELESEATIELPLSEVSY
ncbi:MAG TPA: stage 0 sporulation family protein [Dehalococcoidia bacterium]|jgi:cell fate regulator YaaT (PSP1 superfamily)|nr:stage 0 sporulation family protein [Dehalococcoidia bacterium]